MTTTPPPKERSIHLAALLALGLIILIWVTLFLLSREAGIIFSIFVMIVMILLLLLYVPYRVITAALRTMDRD